MLPTDIKKITQGLNGEFSSSPEVLEKYSEDTSIFKIKPSLVVSPKDSKDLQKLVKNTIQFKGEISLTARSAGTDMSGGPLSKSVVVDFLKHFNKIKSVSSWKAVSEPGVFYRDFEKQTLKQNLILPCYTASKDLNTVGGMVANNSAGEKSLTYGKADRYVEELKVVLSDGNEYTLKKLNRSELEDKKKQNDFEGSIYRDIEKIILKNKVAIQEARPKVTKNSSGYAIWDVWNDKEDTFDLTKLFVGSQGTLGLISEITFRLVEPKNHSRLLVLFLRKKHLAELGEIVNCVLKEKPESFESYDDKTFNVMLKVFPKLFKRLGGNPFTLLRNFWPEIKMTLRGGIPKLVLMAEFTDFEEESAVSSAKKAEVAVKRQYNIQTHITRDAKEAEKFWTIRRESFKLLRENVKNLHTAPFIDDMVVAPKHLPEFLPRLYKILDEYKLLYTVAGHVGDGNFHIIPLMDFSRPDFAEIISELSDRVYTLVGEYHGSITGEHNDGIIRTPYLYKIYKPEVLRVFSEIKDVFDPQRIFNPNKKVDPSFELMQNSIKSQT